MTFQLRLNADDLICLDDTVAALPEETLRVQGGLAKGTKVLTAKGETNIEDIQPGDRVITRERGMARVTSVTTVTEPGLAVRADSLGLGRPEQECVLAGSQHVLLRDWRAAALFDCDAALVPLRRLMDGTQIADAGDTTLYQLVFDTPLTIYANGLETATGRTETGIVESVKA